MTNDVIAGFENVEKLLLEMGADQFPHGRGRSLQEHLTGTRAILRRWSQPDWVSDAGALHSIYGTDAYRRQLVPMASRCEVQAAVGLEAERLAYLFGIVSRQELFRQLERRGRIPAEGLHIEYDGAGAGAAEQISSGEVASLLILHMANTAEQSCSADGSPGLQLARLSRLGLLVNPVAVSVPPILDGCTQAVSQEDESAARDAYMAGLAAMSTDRAIAIREMSQAAKFCPWVGEPALWLAYLELQKGDYAMAGAWIERAQKTCSQWGTAWDKRLSYEQWCWLIDFVAGQASEREIGPLPAPDPQNLPQFLDRLKKRNWVQVYLGSRTDHGPVDAGLPRFHRYIASLAEPDCAARMKIYPGVRARAWHEPEDFPLARALENEFVEIRREILALDQRRFAPESEPIHRSGNWNVLFFNERGRRNEEVCALCPITSRVIDSHRAVRTLAGMSYVSRLSQGTHVSPHHGPTNLRLRCHLGIRVPSGNCGIRVDGKSRQWEEGKCLVFDDFLPHEVWNHTAEDRVVLIVDLWHPDLSDEEVRLVEGLHRYTSMQMAWLNAYWSANEKARSEMDDRGSSSC
jgi:hypothetical protein